MDKKVIAEIIRTTACFDSKIACGGRGHVVLRMRAEKTALGSIENDSRAVASTHSKNRR